MNKVKSFSRAVLVAAALCTMAGSVSASDQASYSSEDGQIVAAKVVWDYKPDSLFRINTTTGFLTDIALKPGEQVTYIAAGDSQRWLIDQASVNGTTHLYIKPISNDISTNLIVNTSARTYRFFLTSTKDSDFNPIISFSFKDEDKAKALMKPIPISKESQEFLDIYTEKVPGNIGSSYEVKKINRHYKVKRHGKIADDLYPLEIFDDGTRTYIKMPKSNKYDMPVLYDVDESKKLTLVNYRMNGQFMVADKVFQNARLVYSPKSYLDVFASDEKDRYKLPSEVDYSSTRKLETLKEQGEEDDG